MPGGTHKFVIRYDEVTKQYWTLSNKNTIPGAPWQRNVLTLSCSKDLRNWQVVKILMEDDQEISAAQSLDKTSFSYADWFIEGDNIQYVIRCGYGDSKNFHDTNYIAYDVVENFRQYSKDISFDKESMPPVDVERTKQAVKKIQFVEDDRDE